MFYTPFELPALSASEEIQVQEIQWEKERRIKEGLDMDGKIMKEAEVAEVGKVAKEPEVAEVDVVSTAKCCCCGLVEECTLAYIMRVRERFGGRWICGLCSEAVKEERARSKSEEKLITMDEALKRHTKFRQQFRSSATDHKKDFIDAVKQIFFRTLDCPRKKEKFACRPLGRSSSCFPTMETTPPRTTETHTE